MKCHLPCYYLIYIYIYIYIYIFESFGSCSDVSLDTLKTIASKTVSVNTISFSQSLNNLLQQLSVKLWSYNARMILSRLLLDNNDSNFSSWDLPVS